MRLKILFLLIIQIFVLQNILSASPNVQLINLSQPQLIKTIPIVFLSIQEIQKKSAYKAARRNAIIGVSEGLEELGLETQTAYTLGSAVSTDVNNRISGNSSALTNPFVNTFGAGVKYGLSEIGDSLGLNHFEMTGISIASEGLFKGATNMSSTGLGQGFSDTINNRISSVLSNTAQAAINSSLNGQPLNLDLGSMALSAYSNSIGAQLSQNLGLMLNQPEFNLDTGRLNISQRGGLASAIDETSILVH